MCTTNICYHMSLAHTFDLPHYTHHVSWFSMAQYRYVNVPFLSYLLVYSHQVRLNGWKELVACNEGNAWHPPNYQYKLLISSTYLCNKFGGCHDFQWLSIGTLGLLTPSNPNEHEYWTYSWYNSRMIEKPYNSGWSPVTTPMHGITLTKPLGLTKNLLRLIY